MRVGRRVLHDGPDPERADPFVELNREHLPDWVAASKKALGERSGDDNPVRAGERLRRASQELKREHVEECRLGAQHRDVPEDRLTEANAISAASRHELGERLDAGK